jgi:broad specificity polyphosphatase/5'/3'-nucleotidase SurE
VHQPEAQQAWRDLSDLCVDLLGEILASGLLEVADVVSVNLPFDADGTTPRHVTALARVGYGSLFGRGDDGLFHHCRVGYEPFGDLLGTDVEAAGDHVITITPIVAPQTPGIDDAVRDRLERRH